MGKCYLSPEAPDGTRIYFPMVRHTAPESSEFHRVVMDFVSSESAREAVGGRESTEFCFEDEGRGVVSYIPKFSTTLMRLYFGK